MYNYYLYICQTITKRLSVFLENKTLNIMGLSKSKRKSNYKFSNSGEKYIHYVSWMPSINNGEMQFLLVDENGERKDIGISIQELLMTKCINVEKLTALIDKKLK